MTKGNNFAVYVYGSVFGFWVQFLGLLWLIFPRGLSLLWLNGLHSHGFRFTEHGSFVAVKLTEHGSFWMGAFG